MSTSDSIFPPEIFYEILKFYPVKIHDLTFLWTTCRTVSQDFKKAVEMVFVERHLNKMSLLIDGGMVREPEHGKVNLSCDFEFVHLSESNPSIAIFKETQCVEKFRAIVKKRMEEMFECGLPMHNPKIYIQIRHEINDTAIPGFQPDWENLEIGCDWVQLLSAFFREEKEFSRRLHNAVQDAKEKIRTMREQVNKGNMDEMALMEWGLKFFANNYDSLRADVRLERIRKEIWDKDQVEWTGNGANGFAKLKIMRRDAGFNEPYSDEDDGEQSEKQDEDSDEQDEEDEEDPEESDSEDSEESDRDDLD